MDLSWCPRISDAALEFIACDLADTLQTLVLDRYVCSPSWKFFLGIINTHTQTMIDRCVWFKNHWANKMIEAQIINHFWVWNMNSDEFDGISFMDEWNTVFFFFSFATQTIKFVFFSLLENSCIIHMLLRFFLYLWDKIDPFGKNSIQVFNRYGGRIFVFISFLFLQKVSSSY